MPLIGALRMGVDPERRPEHDGQMRYPRASAVIVALSTFVAIVTISAVASQLAPLDRAGAVLPEGPITVDGQEADADIVEETTPAVEEPATSAPPPSGSSQNSGGTATGSDATVVVPAPAETLQPEPEPEPTAQPSDPGNSGDAPGKPDEPGSHSGQNKP